MLQIVTNNNKFTLFTQPHQKSGHAVLLIATEEVSHLTSFYIDLPAVQCLGRQCRPHPQRRLIGDVCQLVLLLFMTVNQFLLLLYPQFIFLLHPLASGFNLLYFDLYNSSVC